MSVGPTISLSSLGEKIFLDRYAQKDPLSTLVEGDLVLYRDEYTKQKEIGHVVGRPNGKVQVIGPDGGEKSYRRDELDRPIETIESALTRIALGASDTSEQSLEFQWLLDGPRFIPAGRILESLGTGQGTTAINCFVLPCPVDSRSGIFERLEQMAELMCKGGGVGINYSSLRPENAYVKGVNGRSSGAVSWLELFSYVTNLIIQGGSRRGAQMAMMSVWHPDILRFINLKQDNSRATGCNMSVIISDEFMDAVKSDKDWVLRFPDTSHADYTSWDGDLYQWELKGLPVTSWQTLPAKEVWNAIVSSAHACAEPGLWFQDRANSERPGGARMVATNPCQPGWATVATPEGIRTFDQVDVGSTIWHGERWTQIVRKLQTGVKQVNGYRTRAGVFYGTENHNIYSHGRKVQVGVAESIDTCQVHGFPSVRLEAQDVVDGLVMGDGMSKRFARERDTKYDRVLLCVGSKDNQAYANSEIAAFIGEQFGIDRERQVQTTLTLEEVTKTYDREIPKRFRFGSSVKVCGFLRGLYSANGSVVANRVTLKASSFKVVEVVQEMLSSLGIASYYTTNKAKRVQFTNGEYICKESYDLNIGSWFGRTQFARMIGFIHQEKNDALALRLRELVPSKGGSSPKTTFEIVAVEDMGEHPVYSITVDDIDHKYWTAGLQVANCGEQGLPGYGVCNLGHLVMTSFVKSPVWLGDPSFDIDSVRKATRYAVAFLDNVIDRTNYPIPETAEMQRVERRIGLGTVGLGEALIRLGIRYGSAEALAFCDQVYSQIVFAAYDESANRASQLGPAPSWDRELFIRSGFGARIKSTFPTLFEKIMKVGLRNVCLLTQAPTGTVGTMLGTSTGIEPYYLLEWQRNSRLGSHLERAKVVDEYRQYFPEGDLPHYFTTAMDLSPSDHVDMQAAIQRWTDSSISKTINCPNDWTVDQIGEVYQRLYDKGCKGGSVYRDGCRMEQVLEAPKADSPTAAPAVRDYPGVRDSKTVSLGTPCGTVHVTLTHISGEPLEVFATTGKAGSEVMALTEAVGRLLSLVLRVDSPVSPSERLRLALEQLEGIGGSNPIGLGPNRVSSLPDGIGKALRKAWLPMTPVVECPDDLDVSSVQVKILSGDLCPSCGGMARHEGGCITCSCGWSKCG